MTAAKKTIATKTKAVASTTKTVKPTAKKTVATKTVKPAAKKTVADQVKEAISSHGPFIVKMVPDQKPKANAGKKAEPKTTKAPKAEPKAARADKGPSKMDEAIKVWDSMPNAPRKLVIAAFIDKAKLTPAGANTYFALIKAKKSK